MTRMSNEALKFYRPLDEPYIGCKVCSAVHVNRPIYHPPVLAPGEFGHKIIVCGSCYSYYRLVQPSNEMPLEKLLEVLSTRKRRSKSIHKIKRNSLEFKRKWYIGLVRILGSDGTVESAYDDDTQQQFDPKEVNKFDQARPDLMEMNLDEIKEWCQNNLTDQRLINKIVSSFSS